MQGADWPLINEYLPLLWVEDTCGIVATDGERLLGAIVYDNWQTGSVQTHLLIRDVWIIRRGFLHLMFEMAFQDPDRRYMYGLVPGDNKASLRLCRHMGFTEKCRLHGAIREGVDYVIMEMDREKCRWLNV